MIFDYINDAHIDFWVPFNPNQIKFEKRTREFAHKMIPEQPSKVLLIGGDLGHFNRQNYWFLEELSHIYAHILLVFGNHDYYLISGNQKKKYKANSLNRTEEMKALVAGLDNVKYLEGDTIEIEGVVFGGTGAWYDFSFGQEHFDQTFDEVRATWANNSNDFKLISGFSTIEKFKQEMVRLDDIVEQSDVILTHVGPNSHFTPFKNSDSIHNSYYFFNGCSLLEAYQNKIWCFGHIHIQEDTNIEGWRYISHGLGYPSEDRFKKFIQIKM